jgi:hypothetical protein
MGRHRDQKSQADAEGVGRSSPAPRDGVGGRRGYCFFSGVIGVTGCDPPVDFGPGVTPALLSVEPFELLVSGCVGIWLSALRGPAAGVVCARGPGRRTAPGISFRLRHRRGRQAESDH